MRDVNPGYGECTRFGVRLLTVTEIGVEGGGPSEIVEDLLVGAFFGGAGSFAVEAGRVGFLLGIVEFEEGAVLFAVVFDFGAGFFS